METKVFWFVSLSNGEVFHEGKGNYKLIDGEDTPYLRLLAYIEKNKLQITTMGLYTHYGQQFVLHSMGKNPKFGIFEESKPKGYRYFKKMARDLVGYGKGSRTDLFVCVEAIYENHSIQLWVSNDNPRVSWLLSKNND